MKISIITVCYNSEKTIRNTLESINSQNSKKIEHLIIDGQSTDNTLSIVDEFLYEKKIVSEPLAKKVVKTSEKKMLEKKSAAS